MTFQQLQYVLEVARCGSINKAAQGLFVSQSSISKLLKDLEEELGVTLFCRTNRGITVTDQGKEFIGYARILVEQKRRLEGLYSAKEETPSLHFSISSQHYPFAVDGFLRFLGDCNPPQYVLHMIETDMYQVIEDVYQSRSEIGVIFLSNLTETFIKKVLKSKGLVFHQLQSLLPHVYVGVQHPLAGRESVRLEEIETYPIVVFEQESGVGMDFSEEIALLDLRRTGRIIYIKDRSTFYNVVENTDAFSIGSGILPRRLSSDRVVSIPIAGEQDAMKLGWIAHQDKPVTREMTAFLHHMTEALNDALSPSEEMRQ